VIVTVLLMVSLLCSSFLANDDLRRSEGGSGAMRGSSAVKEFFGAPSPGEFFGALSVLEAAETGGMSSRYGANGKTAPGAADLLATVTQHGWI
jgi:hypothetical protein